MVPHVNENMTLERMELAVNLVKDRLIRAVRALEAGGVPYAVIGGNAVANWVIRVDPEAARNTADVDLLLRRSDLETAKSAMAKAGFIYRHSKGIDMFLDGPHNKARNAVHILFAGEKVRPNEVLSNPDVADAEQGVEFRILAFEPLVRMKLNVFWRKDQVHLQDFLRVGLLDETWLTRLPPELAPRLKELIDDPDDYGDFGDD